MDSLLSIGTDEKAVKASRDAILEIMNQRADQLTIQIAIKALVDSIQPMNTMVTSCNFINNEKEDEKMAAKAKVIGEKLKKSKKRGGD